MSRSILRRPGALLLSSLLGLGAVPLLASAAAADITMVTPDAAFSNTVVRLTVEGDGVPPFNPLSDKVRLKDATYNEAISCGDPILPETDPESEEPASDNDTLIVDCSLTAATPTSYDVVVDRPPYDTTSDFDHTEPPTTDDVRPNGFTVIGQAPTLASFTPSQRARGSATTTATLTGTKFTRNMTYAFVIPVTGLVDTQVTFTPTTVTGKTVTGNLTVGSAALLGSHDLRVTTADPSVLPVTLSGALTVTDPPTYTSATPNDNLNPGVGQGAVNKLVTINGTGFQTGVTVTENPDNPGLSFCGTANTTCPATFVSSTQITVQATVTDNASTVNPANIEIANTDGGKTSFSLKINPKPIITNAAPASRGQGTGEQQVVLTGSTFWNLPGKTTQFSSTSTTPDGFTITAQQVDNFPLGCTTNCEKATLTVVVDEDATIGVRGLRATNHDGGTSQNASALVINAKPTVTSVEPGSRTRGTRGFVTVRGTGFSAAGGVPTVTFGAGTTVHGVVVVSSTALTVDLEIAPEATQGPRNVTVTNSDGGTGSCTGCFHVDGLSVTSVSPNPTGNDSPRQLTINGSGFSATGGAPSVVLDYNGTAAQPNIPGTNVVVVNANQITALFDLTRVAPGAYTTIVTNANGDTGSCSTCLTVIGSQPTATDVEPDKAPAGTQDLTLTITGTNFSNGATVTFSKAGITAQTTTVVSTTRITVVVDISPQADKGLGNVTVTLTDGKTATCLNCFEVTAAPTVTQVNPNTLARGSTAKPVTITGTGFATGATVTFGVEEVTATDVVVTNATTITAKVTVSNSSPLGPISVTVRNPDGGQGGCADCFNVSAHPTITSVSPDKGGRGSSVVVTITGTGFAPGTPVVTAGDGITVTSATRVSATQITATFGIAPNAALGPRDVTVTTPDGGTATKDDAFTVVTSPTLTSLSPNSRAQGTPAASVTFTGSGFEPNAGTPTITFTGAGVTATNATIVNATTITADVAVASDAAVGQRSVTVTLPDGGTATCTNCFTVTSASPFTVRLFDTNGTATTTDDTVETTKPVSGTTYRVTTTARQGTANDAPTDQTYTGTPVLTTSPADTQLTAACGAAVNGVSECTANFGDLGPRTLTATGQGGDSNRVGTLAIVTQPIGLQFTSAPTSGSTGQTLSYTMRPTAKIGASTAGYNATRLFQVTGTGSSRADNSTITCSSATCTFTVSFSSGGTKTIQVTDNSTPARATPVVTVSITELGRFVPLTPARVLETRPNRTPTPSDGIEGMVGGNRTISVQMTGKGGVPVSDVTAVALNVTVTGALNPSNLTLYPTGGARPEASAINFTKGETVANMAVIKVGSGGRINVYNQSNPTHVVLDVVGYYTGATGAGGRLIGLTPKRIAGPTTIGEKATRIFDITGGSTTVPEADVSGVVLSVTGANPSKPTYLTVFPGGVNRPVASSLNVAQTRTVSNLVMVPVNDAGEIQIYNAAGSMKIALDVVGYYTETSSNDVGRFVALVPARIVDTRDGTGGVSGTVGPGETISPLMTGKPLAGVPSDGVSAVIINVTVTGGSARSYLTIYPQAPKPGTNNVSFLAGQVTANLAVAKLGDDNRIRITNAAGEVHVVVDIVGYVTE